jgi:hypothetical protein
MLGNTRKFIYIGFIANFIMFSMLFVNAKAFAANSESGNDWEVCYDVPAYNGINSVPIITSQILPSLSSSDTVTNDKESPLGEGPHVVIGYWEQTKDYTPNPDDNPCSGEPTMKIAYPVDAKQTGGCYSWKHWTSRDSFNGNSAKLFSCSTKESKKDKQLNNNSFTFTQWTSLTCSNDDTSPQGDSGIVPNPEGNQKTAWTKKCCQDMPKNLYSQVLNYDGCRK